MTTTTYTVSGMTCDHCVRAVTEELTALEGVQKVDIDLGTGRVTVTGDDVAEDDVAAAVDEAGYALIR